MNFITFNDKLHLCCMCIYISKYMLNSYVFLFMGGDFIMKKIKNFLNHIFIDGLCGMALGLFSTLYT